MDIVMVIFDLFIVNVVAGIGFVMVIVKVIVKVQQGIMLTTEAGVKIGESEIYIIRELC